MNKSDQRPKKDENTLYIEVQPEWKKQITRAWKGVRKVTSTGVKKSEQWSKIAKHQVRRGILNRNRDKLFTELGELTYQLLSDRKLRHEDLERPFERIRSIDRNIDEETNLIESLKSDS